MLNPRQLAALRRAAPENRNRLAAAIRLAKVTQVKLAEAVDLPQSRISEICNGRYGEHGLPLETARRFAEHFGCGIDDLFPAERQQVA